MSGMGARAEGARAAAIAVGEPSLARLVAVNLGWGVFTQVMTRVLTAATGIILARILTPADYGVFAVAIIFMELALSVNDLGLMTAIVRHQGEVRLAARTATSLIVASSLALYTFAYAASPWVAAALNVPEATTVLRVAALVIPIDAACAVPAALLTRAFRQNRRAVAEIAGLAAYAALSIALALHGQGVWSLVWGRVGGAVLTAVVLIALAPGWPLPGLDRRELPGLLRFGLPVAGAGVLSMLLLNLDYIVVGRLLGRVQLGFYLVAFNLCTWPFQLVFLAVQRVSVVSFARLAGDRRALAAAFNWSVALLVACVLPACLAIALLAGPLVRVVYGGRWSPAAAPLQFLAVFGGVRVLEAFVENMLAGVGRSLTVLAIVVTWLVTLLPAIVVGARLGGIQGVGIAHAAVAAGIVLPVALLTTRLSGVGLRPLLRRGLPLASAALAATAVVLLIQRVLAPDLPQLLGGGAALLVVYAGTALSWPSIRALLSTSKTLQTAPNVQELAPAEARPGDGLLARHD